MAAVGPGGGVISKQPIKTSRRRYFHNGCRVEACGPLRRNHCIIIAFAIGCALFVKDAWEGYQANEASIKISREKVEYMEHPAVTMW